jgi:DNA polymerase-3 subunit chi
MQVDFYQLTRDPATSVVPLLAQRALDAGERMLVVTGGAPSAEEISAALWNHQPQSFMAHAIAGQGDDAAQPVLISDVAVAGNGARFCLIADGIWRDGQGFDRIFFLFPPERTEAARDAWRALSRTDEMALNYWRQDGGKWRKGP